MGFFVIQEGTVYSLDLDGVFCIGAIIIFTTVFISGPLLKFLINYLLLRNLSIQNMGAV